MRIAIAYFSGTGNTAMCVTKMKEVFDEKGQECFLLPLERGMPEDLSDFDVLILGYPVHAFNAPEIILSFAESLSTFPKDKNIYVVKTSGEGLSLNEHSSIRLSTILRKRGYAIEGEFHYLMPYDMVFRHTEDMAYRMWETAKALIPLDCKVVLEGKGTAVKTGPFLRFLLCLFRVEQKASGLLCRTFRVSKKCTRCGLCVRDCPTKNIAMTEKGVRFSNRCLLCMRCAFRCPANAIHIGILDFMKVNGPYRFRKTGDIAKEKKYCRKSYERYFRKAEERIRKAKED